MSDVQHHTFSFLTLLQSVCVCLGACTSEVIALHVQFDRGKGNVLCSIQVHSNYTS